MIVDDVRARRGLGLGSEEFRFDGEQAEKYAREIAFPRKVGTEGESKVARLITGFLKDLGYQVREERFSILIPPWIWMKGMLLLAMILLVIPWLTLEKRPMLALLCAVGLMFWIVGRDKLWIRLGRWVVSDDPGGWGESKNILAEFPEDNAGRPFFLMAHYDSKSQLISLYARTLLFLLGCFSSGGFASWVMIAVLRQWLGGESISASWLAHGCFFLSLGLNLFFVFTTMGNDSEGGIDNASGVGVVLELARGMRRDNPRGVKPIFVFTGAEELGLLGSLMIRKKHGHEMAQARAFVMNIDSVGQANRVRACSSGRAGKRWLEDLLRLAQEKGLRLRSLPFLKGILMDHLPFGSLGIPSISLTSVLKEGWYLHTARDRSSLIRKEGLEAMGNSVWAAIQSLEGREGQRERRASPG